MLMAALSQWPRSENNPDVHQLINGQTTYGVFIQRTITEQYKGKKF